MDGGQNQSQCNCKLCNHQTAAGRGIFSDKITQTFAIIEKVMAEIL
jgi:hypothetical protein